MKYLLLYPHRDILNILVVQGRSTEDFLFFLQVGDADDCIIAVIDKNVEMGNLSSTEAFDLKALTTLLYMKIYSKYKELEDFTMRLCDQSLELPSDKYEKTVEELEEENKELKDEVAGMKGAMNNMESVINELRATISRLEKQLQVQQEK